MNAKWDLMNIKHNEIDIPEKDPFSSCKLGRKKYADVLSNIVNSYSFGFVLAINNKWGTGKTTFVKMWEQDLKNRGHKTLYFNAWENDFEDNPLTALMGELKSLTTISTEPQFKSTLKKAATLSKHIVPIVAQAIADKYINTEGVKEAIEGVTKGLTDVFENEVYGYAEKKRSIAEFKEYLGSFIANTYEGKPLVFIVDELDRCRPNYAVSILEQIKHFFSVPNVVFVLSIDKVQLGNAVKGVYGSDFIDSDEYLRRFIDLEYSIPLPNEELYCEYLYEYFDFGEFFDSLERSKFGELRYDGANFLKISKLLFSSKSISLRQQEKIFALARVALRSFRHNNFVVPHIFLFLAYIKIANHEFYENLKNKSITLQETQINLLHTVVSTVYDDAEYQLMWLEGCLLVYYQNYLDIKKSKERLYKYDAELGVDKLLIDSVINKERRVDFLNVITSIYGIRNSGNLNLGYFFNRLELLEDLST